MTKNRFPTFLRLLAIGLATISFPLAQAQSLDAFLENSILKIGVNAGSYGGAIVWFSGSNGANLVNTYDKGREIQQSFYAGSNNTAANQSPSWSPWPWNPIMVGDYADNVSPVLALHKSAGQIYVKTRPLLWDRNNQLSQSYMEQWISLHPTLPNVVAVDCRFTSFRDPNDEWGAPVLRDQELPALYFVSALNTIKAYTGNAPWTHGELATIPNSPSSGTFPWSFYDPTEPWTACVDANGSGVGVYTPIATTFLAGKSGSGVTTNPFDISTMYISPLGQYAFAADTVFTYRFYLIIGSLTGIREAVYTLRAATEAPPPPPTGLAAISANQQIKLIWNPAPNTTIYHVKRAARIGGPYTLIASVAATHFTDESLTNGIPYHYVVSSENSVGEGADSPPISATATVPILVPNAGFENPSTATFEYNPTGAQWAFDSASGISRNGSAFTSGNPSTPEGVQVAFLQGGGASVSTLLEGITPGAEYRLTFSAAQRAGYTGQTWNAMIDGSVIGSFAPPNTARNHVDYTATFTASATSSLLAFVGTNLNGGDNTVFIDNVRIAQIAEAPTITLLSDNFNTVGVGNTAFNDITSLAADQDGSLSPLSYAISSTGWDGYIQRGAGGRMLLAGYDFPTSGSAFTGQMFASLNHNFAAAANTLNARLQIKFNLNVTDSADPTNWGAIALGAYQNQSVNNAANKFSSLFRDNGQTQQFASGSEVGPGLFTFTDGDLITLLLSDSAGTGSAFDGNGSVARLYVNGDLKATFTDLDLDATDGFISFQANGTKANYDNLVITATSAVPDYDAWASSFTPPLSGAAADDDNDGLSNHEEYAFGLTPHSGTSINPINAQPAPSTGTISYTRREASLTKLNHSIWYSTDLAIWTEDTGAVEGTPALQGEVETVPVTLTGSLLTNPKLFIQVRAN